MDYTLGKKLLCFKQIAQEKLQAILHSIPSPKNLIIEANLIKPLEHICVASWVKSKGVLHIYKFDQKLPAPRHNGVTQLFFISANLVTFKHVLDQIHAHESETPFDTSTGIKNYHIIILPTVYSCFRNLLEEEGLYGAVTLHTFFWDFILMDESLLSLELPQVFSEVFVNKNTSIVSSIARSLKLWETVFGKPDMSLSFGSTAENILEIVNSLSLNNKSKPSDFTALIIMDRNKDYPSCLLTPATYTGLLLEVFKYKAGELESNSAENKISTGKIQIISEPLKKTPKSNPITNIRINGKYDEIFAENKYKHFSETSSLVRELAKNLGCEVQNLNKMGVHEMQHYVTKKLPKVTEMKNKILKHLNACEVIVEKLADNFQRQLSLEDNILRNKNKKQVISEINEILNLDGHKYNAIRLLCLAHLSMTLTSDDLNNFIASYINIFGHKYLYIFQSFFRAGLLPEIEALSRAKLLPNLSISKSQPTEFQLNADRLKLFPPIMKKINETDLVKLCPSFVFNGLYIPLIAQLILSLVQSKNVDEIFAKLGAIEGLKCQFSKNLNLNNLKDFYHSVKKGETADQFPLKKRTVFVLIIGGITFAEIAACDLVSRLTGSKIILASDTICSGSDIISASF